MQKYKFSTDFFHLEFQWKPPRNSIFHSPYKGVEMEKSFRHQKRKPVRVCQPGYERNKGPLKTSVRKLAANRENAQKSTGPANTTSTRYNATKHGLRSQGVTELDNPEKFHALVEELKTALQPVGVLEHECVHQIAVLISRIRRARLLEAEAFTSCLNPPKTIHHPGTVFGDPSEVVGWNETVDPVYLRRSQMMPSMESTEPFSGTRLPSRTNFSAGKTNSNVCRGCGGATNTCSGQCRARIHGRRRGFVWKFTGMTNRKLGTLVNPKKRGRGTLLNAQLQRKICDLLAQGHTVSAVCGAVGIGERTFYDWLEKRPHFSQAVTRAIGHSKIALLDKLRLSDDWRAQAFLLERRWPSEFGKVEPRAIHPSTSALTEGGANYGADPRNNASDNVDSGRWEPRED